MHITFMFSISLQLSLQGYVNMYVFHLKKNRETNA